MNSQAHNPAFFKSAREVSDQKLGSELRLEVVVEWFLHYFRSAFVVKFDPFLRCESHMERSNDKYDSNRVLWLVDCCFDENAL